MKRTKQIAIVGLSALTLAAGFTGAASAQEYRGDWNRDDHRNDRDDGRFDNHRYDNRYDNHRFTRRDNQWHRQWRRGDRLPYGYTNHYRSVDWRREHFRAPPRGYHYVRDDRGETLLVGIATGAILSIILSNGFN